MRRSPSCPSAELQAQLHGDAALEQEDRLIVLIPDSVQQGSDDHGVQPSLQADRRYACLTCAVVDEPVKVSTITGQAFAALSHLLFRLAGAGLPDLRPGAW